MLLLAQILDADAALACGFLEGVYAAEALEAEVASLCDRLGALAPVTQTVVKEALRRQTVQSVADTDDLVRLCYGFLVKDWTVRICHVYREANSLADVLANYVFSLLLGVHIFFSVLLCVKTIMRDDVDGTTFPRQVRV